MQQCDLCFVKKKMMQLGRIVRRQQGPNAFSMSGSPFSFHESEVMSLSLSSRDLAEMLCCLMHVKEKSGRVELTTAREEWQSRAHNTHVLLVTFSDVFSNEAPNVSGRNSSCGLIIVHGNVHKVKWPDG